MLPDLRIVIAAVVSTFICTVGVGFYASTRLLQESLILRPDSSDDSPINRIALSWPEPLPVDRTLNLDFAVTARAPKNPVREIAPEPPTVESNAVATPSASDPPAREPQPAPDHATAEPTQAAKETAVETANDAPVQTTNPDRLATAPAPIGADPQATGSILEPAQAKPSRDAAQKTAGLPDTAEAEQETQPQANSAASGAEQPVTNAPIVKKPPSAKPRVKRKARVAKSTTTSQSSAQLQFPFLWFQIPNSQF